MARIATNAPAIPLAPDEAIPLVPPWLSTLNIPVFGTAGSSSGVLITLTVI